MFARVPNSGQGLPASTSSPTTKPASSSTSRCGRPARKWRRSLEARRPASTTRPSQRPGSPHCASKPTKSQRRSEPSPSPSARRPASRATNRYRQTVASSQLLGHSPRDVCRKTGSVMCAGEGTTTGIAPCSCSGASERLPGPTQVPCPVPLAALRTPPDHTWCIGTTYAGRRGRTDGRRDASPSQSPARSSRLRQPASGALREKEARG
jgi:hypothetical protein